MVVGRGVHVVTSGTFGRRDLVGQLAIDQGFKCFVDRGKIYFRDLLANSVVNFLRGRVALDRREVVENGHTLPGVAPAGGFQGATQIVRT